MTPTSLVSQLTSGATYSLCLKAEPTPSSRQFHDSFGGTRKREKGNRVTDSFDCQVAATEVAMRNRQIYLHHDQRLKRKELSFQGTLVPLGAHPTREGFLSYLTFHYQQSACQAWAALVSALKRGPAVVGGTTDPRITRRRMKRTLRGPPCCHVGRTKLQNTCIVGPPKWRAGMAEATQVQFQKSIKLFSSAADPPPYIQLVLQYHRHARCSRGVWYLS